MSHPPFATPGTATENIAVYMHSEDPQDLTPLVIVEGLSSTALWESSLEDHINVKSEDLQEEELSLLRK
jgi:hypothetical protein